MDNRRCKASNIAGRNSHPRQAGLVLVALLACSATASAAEGSAELSVGLGTQVPSEATPTPNERLGTALTAGCLSGAGWLKLGVPKVPWLGVSLGGCGKGSGGTEGSWRFGVGTALWKQRQKGFHYRISGDLGIGALKAGPDGTGGTSWLSLRPEAMVGHFRTPVGYGVGLYLDVAQLLGWEGAEKVKLAPRLAVGLTVRVIFGRFGEGSLLTRSGRPGRADGVVAEAPPPADGSAPPPSVLPPAPAPVSIASAGSPPAASSPVASPPAGTMPLLITDADGRVFLQMPLTPENMQCVLGAYQAKEKPHEAPAMPPDGEAAP